MPEYVKHDADVEKNAGFFIANGLTLLRSALALDIALKVLSGHTEAIPIPMLIGVASDVLDGKIARATGSDSREGALRDRLADIPFFMNIILIALKVAGNPDKINIVTGSLILAAMYLVPLLQSRATFDDLFNKNRVEISDSSTTNENS